MLYKLSIHGLTPRPIEHYVAGDLVGDDRAGAERQAQNIIMSVKVYVTVYVMEVSYEGRVKEIAKFQTGG